MDKVIGYFQLTRPLNLLIAFLSIFLGGFVTGTIQPIYRLVCACVSGSLIMAGANAVNDVFDLEADRINKSERPLPSGRVTVLGAAGWACFLFLAGIFAGSLVHLTAFCIALGSSLLLVLYSYRLKGTVLWGNVTVAFVTGLAFVYGGLAVGRIRIAAVIGVFAFFFHLAREIIKDVEDMEGDRLQGLRTLPIRYGIKVAMACSTGILSLLILLTIVPYILELLSVHYLIAVVLGVDLFLVYVMISMWKKPTAAHMGRLAVWMKADMFMGLAAVYLGMYR